jgi:hypothetical protein
MHPQVIGHVQRVAMLEELVGHSLNAGGLIAGSGEPARGAEDTEG